MNWHTIDTAPNDGSKILVGFKGQFAWFYYVTDAKGVDSQSAGYAKPTHWTDIQEPNDCNIS